MNLTSSFKHDKKCMFRWWFLYWFVYRLYTSMQSGGHLQPTTTTKFAECRCWPIPYKIRKKKLQQWQLCEVQGLLEHSVSFQGLSRPKKLAKVQRRSRLWGQLPVSVHKDSFEYVCQHMTYFFLILLCLHMKNFTLAEIWRQQRLVSV